MSQRTGGSVKVGVSVSNPANGSLGEWVGNQESEILGGTVSPKHLSFLGPVYGRMSLVVRGNEGRAILWQIPSERATAPPV